MSSRSIKFRIWDKKQNRMFRQKSPSWIYEHETSGGFSLCFPMFEEEGYLLRNEDDYIAQQFTTLTDSNGQDIYEGDILKVSNCYPTDDDEFSDLSQVVEIKFGPLDYCQAPAFKFVAKDGRDFDFYGGTPDYMVVVGNIFENPELLK